MSLFLQTVRAMEREYAMSNWTDADRRRREETLACTRCDAANRPGVRDVEIREDGKAACNQCGHVFIVSPKERGQ